MSNSNNTPQVNHQNLSTCVIRKLERASSIAPSPNAQPFKNDPVLITSFVVENNREKRRITEGKRPSEMSLAEHDALPSSNWQSAHKHSVFAVNNTARRPILFKHLLVHTAAELNPHESYGSLNNRCDTIASVVNNLLRQNRCLGKVGNRPSKLKLLIGR